MQTENLGAWSNDEAADVEARRAISGDLVYGRPPVASDFLLKAKRIMVQDWLQEWDIEYTPIHSLDNLFIHFKAMVC
jgi:hypothetical protein